MKDPGISIQGIIFIDVVGLVLVVFLLHLVRSHRLYVGYALMWFLSLAILMVIVSIPPLLNFVTRAVGAIFPASALSMLAFIFIFLILIFISVKLTALSNRQIKLIQHLAINELLTDDEHGTED
jgi:hypothetical protein